MSRWKPINEMPTCGNGFLFRTRSKEIIFEGWRGTSGQFYRCPTGGSLDPIIDAVPVEPPEEWKPLDDAAPKKPKKSKWVRVEDRKPEKGNYLCYKKDDAVYDAWYVTERDEWHTDGTQRILGNVTHWRPMPKGPKSDE